MRKITTILLLFVCMSSIAFAQNSKRYGDWTVGIDQSGNPYASTISSSGEILSKKCFVNDDTCSWFLAIRISCEAGQQAPALFSINAGSSVHNLKCVQYLGSVRLYSYLIFDPDDIDRMTNDEKGVIGIAFALKDGKFTVNRFSMSGASVAVANLMSLANALSQSKSPKTGTSTL